MRTVAEQNELIRRWDAGGTYNRPPYLYPPARPANASRHVVDGGIAIDIGDYREFMKHSEEFGFVWWGESDPVHFEFTGWKPPTVKPAPIPKTVDRKKKKMDIAVIHTNGKSDKTRRGAIIDTKTGTVSTFGDFPVSYANGVAAGFGLAKSAPVTSGHFAKILKDFGK